jgi:hypothetical protein
MNSIINMHVIDPQNIGDLLSAPIHYFPFPGYEKLSADLRELSDNLPDSSLIVGGGGLLFPRFLERIQQLTERPYVGSLKRSGKLIAWGVGQQTYGAIERSVIQSFNYSEYLDRFDLVGIRDIDSGYNWVPCASCMNSSFDQPREIKHEFVVFSHKKFQLHIDKLPRMTHANDSLDEVLDFLGSGETILTSSYHGAYWGTLLGRKVLAFPFSSKFATFKHQPGLYLVQKWSNAVRKFQIFGKTIHQSWDENQLLCPTEGWQEALKDCLTFPESLEECRDRNQWFYQQVLNCLC